MADNKPRLGTQTVYPEAYDPDLLVSIPRAAGRAQLTLPEAMCGADIWTGYEVSWLEPGGKPRVAVAEFTIDCQSPYIVESKSFKLYLNSLNQQSMVNDQAVVATLEKDLAVGFGDHVAVTLYSPDAFSTLGLTGLPGECLDDQQIDCSTYEPTPEYLSVKGGELATEALYSHLLKTNCPVTGQPDWASVSIAYTGPQLDREGLLRYLVSFRGHQGFHENCVETIFSDILQRCRPQHLTVYARYTRRGGLDINPWRSTESRAPDFMRLSRQ